MPGHPAGPKRPSRRLTLLAAAGVLGLCAVVANDDEPTSTSTAPTAAAPSSSAAPTATSPLPSVTKTKTRTHNVVVTSPPPTSQTHRQGGTLDTLATLPIKGRAPMTGYDRVQFGPAWTDATNAPLGHNGCGTRDDILARQLQHVVLSGPCKVATGDEIDPYSGRPLYYVRGRSTVDIDHVVALGDAWQKGAQQLTGAERTQFANDPLNLLAVSAAANRQKGDGDAATWLPKVKAFRCEYVARQVAVKARYRLWVTRAEHDAIARILAGCPDLPLPSTGAGRAQPAPPAPTTPTETQTQGVATGQDCTPGYRPCIPLTSDADCAGGAGNGPTYVEGPVYVTGNDPYGLDADGDGVACNH